MLNQCHSRKWCSLNGKVVKVSVDKIVAKNQRRTVYSFKLICLDLLYYHGEKQNAPKKSGIACVRENTHFLRKEALCGIAAVTVNTTWLGLNPCLPSSMPCLSSALLVINYLYDFYSWIFQILSMTIIFVMLSKIWHSFCFTISIGRSSFRDFHMTLS